jgi:hypothetical protein
MPALMDLGGTMSAERAPGAVGLERHDFLFSYGLPALGARYPPYIGYSHKFCKSSMPGGQIFWGSLLGDLSRRI